MYKWLTDRQAEVLDRKYTGMTHAEIAKDMGLSPRTIDVHLAAITKKAKLNGYEWRTKLVRIKP